MHAAARQVLLALLLFLVGCNGEATLVQGIPPEPALEAGVMEGGAMEGGPTEGGPMEGGAKEGGGTDGGATDAVEAPVSNDGATPPDAQLEVGDQ